jgi:hypothetical protein
MIGVARAPPGLEDMCMSDLRHSPTKNSTATAGLPIDSIIALFRALIPLKTSRYADRLVTGHTAIPERTMRTRRLFQKLSALPDGILVDIVNDVFMRAGPGDIGRAQFILSCVDIFNLADTPPMRLLALYHLSVSRQYTTTANIFMAPSPKRIPYGEYDFVEGREMDYLTLGEKRSLARTHVKDKLDRLLYDTNPMVVRNILENPSLTEPDVLKMAARRPNHERVITTIYQSDRWISSYDVKTAIVRNPYSPVPIALGLLLFLKQQDLAAIAVDSTLHEVITTTARSLLTRRGAD